MQLCFSSDQSPWQRARRIAIVGASWDRHGGPTNRSDHFVQRSCQDIVSIWDNFDPTDHVNATALNQASPQVGRIATYEIEESMKMSETRTEHRQYCVIKANTIY